MKITITEFDTDNYPSDQPRFEAETSVYWEGIGGHLVESYGETREEAIQRLLEYVEKDREYYAEIKRNQATRAHVIGTEEVTV